MSERTTSYEQARDSIRLRKIKERHDQPDVLDEEWEELTRPKRRVGAFEITKLGTGVLIGGGVGLLAGVATIAVAASVAEVVIGGVITKVCGIVGGAAGLGWGLRSIDKKS